MDIRQGNMQADLIEALGISDLPREERDGLLSKALEVLLKRIFVETMSRLDEEGRKKYMDMVEKNFTPEEVEVFVKEKIPKYDELVMEIARQFRDEMTEPV
jgi:hypothetical protein